jgi:hypothetical protein
MRDIKKLAIILISIFLTMNIFAQVEKKSGNRYIDVYKQYLDSTCPLEKDSIKHFVYFARDRELIHNHPFLKMPRIEGAQIMYAWNQLEPEKGVYDFSVIREDYDYLLSFGKKLFIQLQDATFSRKYIGIPAYLLTDEYDGGATKQFNDEGIQEGWVAKRWNAEVQNRWSSLLQALGKEFDGKIEGINFQESAIGVSAKTDSTFTPELYMESLKINMLALKKSFPKSTTMQYANFMPGEWLPSNDKGYLCSIYEYGQEIGVGLGGPDLMYKRKGQLNHTIAMMHEGKFTVPLGIAIQDGNYIGETGNNKMVVDRKNIVPILHAFAKDFMKVNYMFWVYQEPYFSEDVMPCLSNE